MSTEQPRVLLVEDEHHVATLVALMLEDLGFDVAGCAWRLPQAIQMAETLTVELAVLDVNLAGERVFPVADILMRRAVPLIFATGYGRAGLEPAYRDHPILAKPFRQDQLAAAIADARR